MQVSGYDYFYLRTLYYATRVFNSNLTPSTEPKYGKLKPVYIISIMCEELREPEFRDNYCGLNWFRMYDIENKILAPNGINCIFVNLLNIPNSYEECRTYFEKYCLLIKTIGEDKRAPSEIAGGQFEELLKVAEIVNLLPQERITYEKEVMTFYDFKLSLDQKYKDGRKKGIAEGEAKGKLEMVKTMFKNGMPIETISQFSGIPISELSELCFL